MKTTAFLKAKLQKHDNKLGLKQKQGSNLSVLLIKVGMKWGAAAHVRVLAYGELTVVDYHVCVGVLVMV